MSLSTWKRNLTFTQTLTSEHHLLITHLSNPQHIDTKSDFHPILNSMHTGWYSPSLQPPLTILAHQSNSWYCSWIPTTIFAWIRHLILTSFLTFTTLTPASYTTDITHSLLFTILLLLVCTQPVDAPNPVANPPPLWRSPTDFQLPRKKFILSFRYQPPVTPASRLQSLSMDQYQP